MRSALWVGLMAVLASGAVPAAPEISEQEGMYVLENAFLRAEVKYTELQRLTYKPTGKELMSPGWHGVVNICAKGKLPRKDEDTWLFQDSYMGNRGYDVEAGATEATLAVSFDWCPRGKDEAPYYSVDEKITIFDDKPYIRVRYYITAKQPPEPPPAGFMVQSSGTQGTHFVEPDGELRVEQLGDARLSGMRREAGDYWFAYWDKQSGHYTAFLRPGQTDPSRCMFTKAMWYVARWAEPFLDKPGQSYSEELWIVAGKTEGDDPAPIAQAAQAGYAFAGAHAPVLATLQSPYVTHEELVKQTAHLRADGKGDRVVYKNERLYVDGKPFILFAPWGIDQGMWETYKKYHLTGVFGSVGNADRAQEHGLKIVPSALEWPSKRGPELEEHIRKYADHPAIIAWFLQDDFGGDLSMLANIETIRKVDRHRPTVADVVGYDAGRRQASAFLDINAPYTYPAPVHTYHWYADYLEHDQKIMDRQFNWTCPQAMSYSAFASTGQSTDYYVDYPTAAQMRLQTYLGLAHGIRGFMYWPVRGMYDYKLAELGIVCLEVEPLTELIVEAEKNYEAASTDDAQVEVQRLDWSKHTLLLLINYRDKSERWPTGELVRRFRVALKDVAPDVKAYSMTLDEDMQVGQPRKSGKDMQVEVSGLDVAAMVLVTADEQYARGLQQALEERRAEATEFATTTNRYMAGKAYEILSKLAAMQAPMGNAVALYNEAVSRIDVESSFTGQRRVARMLRQALGDALAHADELADYAPQYAQNSLLINVWNAPQFMASFNFPALRRESAGELSAPPAIASMMKQPEPEKAAPLEVGSIVTDGKAASYVASLEGQRTYCSFLHARGRALHTYAGEAAYLAGRNEFVGLPNDNYDLSVTVCRPAEDMELYAKGLAGAQAFGVLAAEAVQVGQEVAGAELNAQRPVAAYELAAGKDDSFEVTLQTPKGARYDLILCQAHPRYGQTLASGRSDGKEPVTLRCTLPDDAPLAVVVERVSGDGAFTISTKKIEEMVVPEKTVQPFAGVRFGLFGKDTCNFVQILAGHGIAGERLDGKLADSELSGYDAIVVLTNAVKYDEAGELRAQGEKLRQYVQNGGRLALFQQNGRETWHTTMLPYPMELFTSGATKTVPVLCDTRLFAGMKPEDFVGGDRTVVYYPIKVAGTDEHWRYAAYADEAKQQGAIAVCDYGKGRAIINQFAVLDRIGEPAMRNLMVETVRYVLTGE